ncbi:hypothetical protein LJ737_09665 [Hymenobacter sp. 15J16-1T3B]|uniref:TIM-barrel domain-containing protein n=1 Tax=Hymenobacter sp. 15J16-1T3B TaxID=2886941 RepID=UPI001D127CE7|nr:TIM-barrel domain-containing protein [Hymenobacter sp. 15J16-1T3B]MCC3157506.1 hypothetical protein [Hymenobacter sp. 15J16-1T3B]
MPAFVRHLLPLCLGLSALARPALAQREGGGPPGQDPFGRPETPAPVRALGRYRSHLYQRGILTIRSTEGGTLRVRPWAAGVVRVEFYPAGQPLRPDSSLSVVQAPQAASHNCRPGCDGPAPEAALARYGPDVCAGVFDTPAALELHHDCYTVVIQKNPLRVSYQRADGETVAAEAGGAFEQLSGAGGTGVSFRLQPAEHLYGTGSRALPLDRRGRRLTLYNEAHYGYQNGEPTLNVTLPTVLSSRGYLLFFDHHTAGTLDLGATNKNVLEYRGEGLTTLGYFIVAGDSYAEILSRYTALTGRQPLPPRWGLGLIQSRFGYKSEQEMYQVARRMRQAGFPLDALVLDLYWFGGTRQQGDFRWEPVGFPNPRRLTRRLDSLGIKTVLISEPYVMRASRHDALVRRQGLVGRDAQGRPYTVESFWAGPATLLDMYRPAARQWLWQQYDRLKQDGVQGWWTDLGEPENQPADMVYDAGPTRRIHNGYGQMWASILSEGYQRQYPAERLFNLARSGWAGMQRHSVFPWSGDVSRSWAGLQAQVPIMLSMGLGGVGYMHSDAGGFAQGIADPELYTRWLQLAALGPVLRPHGGGDIAPEPYWWPPATQERVRAAVRLRYQLLPYLYSLAWENSQTGTPLTRPMNFGLTAVQAEAEQGLSAEELAAGLADAWQETGNWQADTAAKRAEAHPDADRARQPAAPTWNWNTTASSAWGAEKLRANKHQAFLRDNAPALTDVNDQFFLGPNLLVAPVLQPGQRRRNVVLPAGSWIDFHSHETLPGGQTVGRPAPLAQLPLLVRAGAFVPLTRSRPSTAAYRADTLLVQYFADPGAGTTSFTVYDDDGRTASPAAFQLLTLQGVVVGSQARLTATRGGAAQPERQVLELLLPRVAAPPTAVLLAGHPLPASDWQYDAPARALRLRVALTAAADRASLTVQGLRLDTTPARHADPDALTLEAPTDRLVRGRTTLRYTVHQLTDAPALRLVDSRGRTVRTFATDGTAGTHALPWDARDAQNRPLPGGVYWAELAGQRQRLVVLPDQP